MRVLATVIGRYLLVTPAKWPFQRRLLAWGAAVAVIWLLLRLMPGVLPTGLWTGRIVLGVLLLLGGGIAIQAGINAGRLLLNERDGRTLELLAASDLGGGCLLGYLYLVAILDALVALALTIPLFAWCANLPLVGLRQAVAAFLLATACCHGAVVLGLLAAACCRHRQTAAFCAVAGVYLCLGIPMAVAMQSLVSGGAWSVGWATVSPLYSGMMLCGGEVTGVPGFLLFTAVAGVGVLWLAAWVLPGRLAPATSSPFQEWWARLRHRRRYLRPPPITGNPVAWRDLHFLHGSRLWVWGAAAIILTFTGLWVTAATPMGRTEPLVLGLGVSGLLLMGSAMMAAQPILRERRQGSLELLLATGLSNREILLGKIEGLLRFAAPLLVTGTVYWATGCGALVLDGYWPLVVLANLFLWPTVVGLGLGSFEDALRLPSNQVRTAQQVMPKSILYPAGGVALGVGCAVLVWWWTGQPRWAVAAGGGPVVAASGIMLWQIPRLWGRLNRELREMAATASAHDAQTLSRG